MESGRCRVAGWRVPLGWGGGRDSCSIGGGMLRKGGCWQQSLERGGTRRGGGRWGEGRDPCSMNSMINIGSAPLSITAPITWCRVCVLWCRFRVWGLGVGAVRHSHSSLEVLNPGCSHSVGLTPTRSRSPPPSPATARCLKRASPRGTHFGRGGGRGDCALRIPLLREFGRMKTVRMSMGSDPLLIARLLPQPSLGSGSSRRASPRSTVPVVVRATGSDHNNGHTCVCQVCLAPCS